MSQEDEEDLDEYERQLEKAYFLGESWATAGNAISAKPLRINREFLIENLIDRASVNVIYGPPKSFKTLIAQNMAHHLCTSQEWCNHRIPRRSNVLYLGYEDPESLKLRQAALAQAQQEKLHKNIGYLSIVSTNIPYLNEELTLSSVIEFFEYHRSNGPDIRTNDVLIIDTLNMAFSHLGNENDAQFMAEVAKCTRRFTIFGITVFIIHHSGKDISRGLRGHTALAGAVDNIFLCKKKGKDKIELSQEMWRNGPEGKKLKMLIREVNVQCTVQNQLQSMTSPIVVFDDDQQDSNYSINPSEIKFLNALNNSLLDNAEFYITEFSLPIGVKPALLKDVIERAIEDKIAPKAKHHKSAVRTATRAKDKLLELGVIEEKNSLIWKLSTPG